MADYIVLDRIEPGVTPPYCTHGRATCIVCREWCWLGDKTHDLAISGEVWPVCMSCAHKHFQPDAIIGHVADHRRADGPHD